MIALIALITLCQGALAQLPNLRVGLPADDDENKRLDVQNGYPLVAHDIPFGQRYEVKLRYYDLPDQPLYYRNAPPKPVACCYSFNSYWTANMAIHPFWFKEFGLDRWCRQDVCVSLWTKDHVHDLMYKVTDVCDPKDCPTPLHVKVEPYKGKYLFKDNQYGSRPEGPVYMYFVKCWADGMPQPDLVNTLPGPTLRNSRHWMIRNTQDQWAKNQEWNRKNGRPEVPLGMLVRPWATQTSAAGFRPQDWPPGSSDYIKKQKKC
ncbi:MAG: hypothetical protein J3K34DRAFT_409834 [Monoraphidium minutum]|nr:MAG: hypothetical protein J3K34DRAFT_409834 [Monoraphidium minutum]